ncbi:hypothetical protein FSP39_002954 [Pinctada imbricata]|uniref:Neuropeptide Y n=2 Tax=Pinctada TaxID=50425 RepID=A0AA88YIQ0_PINIB|nr:hypothetical protein FSP39_002954 [Pinctada imbricata]
MNRLTIVAILLTTLLVISEVTSHEAMLVPPRRPSKFDSPAQLRRYLQALNEYYAIVGRPR